jgi:hypothetical protein
MCTLQCGEGGAKLIPLRSKPEGGCPTAIASKVGREHACCVCPSLSASTLASVVSKAQMLDVGGRCDTQAPCDFRVGVCLTS